MKKFVDFFENFVFILSLCFLFLGGLTYYNNVFARPNDYPDKPEMKFVCVDCPNPCIDEDGLCDEITVTP